MPLPKKLMGLVAVTLVFFSSVQSVAENPGGSAKPPEITQDKAPPYITAQGKFADGYLVEEMIPGVWEDRESKNPYEKSPVILRSYLPYPNPYSHPVAFVAVEKQADFRIVVKDNSGGIIDDFTFTNVEAGFYKFTCDRALSSTELAAVVLWWNGAEVGRRAVQEKYLSASY